jgi:hypothetical protein
MRYIFPFDRVNKGDNVILYGMGKVGKSFLTQIMHTNYCKIICMCDKNARGEILSPEVIFSLADKTDKIILCTQPAKWQNEMKLFCLGCGIDESKIIFGNYEPIGLQTPIDGCDDDENLYYSQYAEDVIVRNVFEVLHIIDPGYLDIGCGHPISGNNTYMFYKNSCGRGGGGEG